MAAYFALLVNTVTFRPSTCIALNLHAGALQLSFQDCGRFPCVVVRNLACNVMEDVSLRDTVGGKCTDGTHNGTKITEEIAIQCRQSTTRESVGRSAVMGEQRIGVLEECNEHEPMVDPEVWDQVGA